MQNFKAHLAFVKYAFFKVMTRRSPKLCCSNMQKGWIITLNGQRKVCTSRNWPLKYCNEVLSFLHFLFSFTHFYLGEGGEGIYYQIVTYINNKIDCCICVDTKGESVS